MPTFSVIIPTRNRAELFRCALESVLVQTYSHVEVVVVNDGSSGVEREKFLALKADYVGRVRFVDLPETTTGHGAFRVMNTGASISAGDYLCFLDDDDVWVDPEHLSHAAAIIAGGPAPDVLYFDQAAFSGETRASGPIWLEDLGARLKAGTTEADTGSYRVDACTLLTAHGFAHTNTTIVSRTMFDAVGGFDTLLWYEGDRDFFLRVIDAAGEIRYAPRVCARHNIPDAQRKASMSSSTSSLKKALDQVQLLSKAVRHSKHQVLKSYARRHRRYALRKVIDGLVSHPAQALECWRRVRSFARLTGRTDRVVSVGGEASPG